MGVDLAGKNAEYLRTGHTVTPSPTGLLAIDIDTHTLGHLAFVELGMLTARRTWIGKTGAVNTWPVKKLLPWAARHGR